MNCPYCVISFSLEGVNADNSFPHFERLGLHGRGSSHDEGDKKYSITSHKCPDCRGQIMWLNELGETEFGEIDIHRFLAADRCCQERVWASGERSAWRRSGQA